MCRPLLNGYKCTFVLIQYEGQDLCIILIGINIVYHEIDGMK